MPFAERSRCMGASGTGSAAERRDAAACLHCGTAVPDGSGEAPYCCRGCREVARLLTDEGLARFYDLARGEVVPVPESPDAHSFAWLEPLLARAGAGAGVCRLELDVQGVHCAACVWLMSELFRRRAGGLACTVNPALGKLSLTWREGSFELHDYLADVERFGYRFGPSRKTSARASRDLPIRIGICAALTMNTMMFSASFYAGLAPADGELFRVFTRTSLWLSTLVVAVGGWVFFKSAWEGLRKRVLHLDLPIALGILLVFGTSVVKARDGRGDLAFFDTLDTFVTLMLVGRLLQERLIERNRRYLLDDAGADGLQVRRVTGDRLEVVRAPELRAGDELLVAPSELVPVDGVLLDPSGRCSLDWITGESAGQDVAQGGRIAAGSFNAGKGSMRVRALGSFAESPLPGLLRARHDGASAHATILTASTRFYVPAVLSLAAAAFVGWWQVDHARALQVTVSLLVVTCPCAIGIAVPLAYELAFARLRRVGVFVKAGDLLDRLAAVRKVLFDKTGTVTLSRLELVDAQGLGGLDPGARDAAYDLAARSNHPVSRCLAQELSLRGARFHADLTAREVPGEGVELVRDGEVWRLGRPRFAAAGTDGLFGTVLGRDGTAVATFATRETMRPDARRGLDELRAAGLDVWLVSGDAPAKVAGVAVALGVPPDQALCQQTPEDKAAAVARLDAKDTLYLGDGVNDALAFAQAFCAGTPAVDRPVMPGKADFFLVGEGLGGLRELFSVSRLLRATVRRNVTVALGYNALAVAACLAGWVTPLRAAVAMPVSSLVVLALTVWSLQRTETNEGPPARLAADGVTA